MRYTDLDLSLSLLTIWQHPDQMLTPPQPTYFNRRWFYTELVTTHLAPAISFFKPIPEAHDHNPSILSHCHSSESGHQDFYPQSHHPGLSGGSQGPQTWWDLSYVIWDSLWNTCWNTNRLAYRELGLETRLLLHLNVHIHRKLQLKSSLDHLMSSDRLIIDVFLML